MKTILNSKTIRKATALLMTLMIVTLTVPVSLADSVSLGGTHWYATEADIIYLDMVGEKIRNIVEEWGDLIQFVPEKSWLSYPSLCSVCVTLDLNQDGTCAFFFGFSVFGQYDSNTFTTSYGTWKSVGRSIALTLEGETIPVTYKNGVVNISYVGLGLNFEEI